MRFLSVCSGIEAASVAFAPLGWHPLAFSEIEPFPRAVLKHHHPDVPLHGDFTKLCDEPWIADADMLCGGTPCQAFSIAGKRESLSDDRGNLTLEFVRLADAIDDLRRAAGRPEAWVLWENVPGVLSVGDNAFGAFLGGLVGSESPIEPRERWSNAGVVSGPRRIAAWRVLDAQYFGVAQRRRRVFVLAHGHSRGWACADALLPVSDRLHGHPAPRRETGQSAPTIPSRSTAGGGLGTDFDCDGGLIPEIVGQAMSAKWSKGSAGPAGDEHHNLIPCQAFSIMPMNSGKDFVARPTDVAQPVMAGGPVGGNQGGDYIAHSLTGEGCDASEDGTGRGTPLVPVHVIQERAVSENPDAGPQGKGWQEDVAFTLEGRAKVQAVAFAENSRAELRLCGGDGQVAAQLTTGGGKPGQGQPCIAFSAKDHGADAIEDCSPKRRAGGHRGSHANAGVMPAVAFNLRGRDEGAQPECDPDGLASMRAASGGSSRSYVAQSAVRRLTPEECEALQGFPRFYTRIPYRGKPAEQCPDGPRYRALGNSWAVPCVRWIGERIATMQERRAG